MLHDPLIEVLTSQVGVSAGRYDLKDAVVDGEQRDIEGAASEIIHQDFLLSLLVKSICNGCRSWLIGNTEHIETCNGAGILGVLPLHCLDRGRRVPPAACSAW